MTNKLKLGLVGADAAGRSWAPESHIPALREIEEIDLVALCTSRPKSAAAAAEAFNIKRAYHDVNELVAQPDIDIIAAVVKIHSSSHDNSNRPRQSNITFQIYTGKT